MPFLTAKSSRFLAHDAQKRTEDDRSAGRARGGIGYWWESLTAFVGGGRSPTVNVVVLGFLVWLGYRVRRWSQGWSADDPTLERARFVASRPLIAAVTFALVAYTVIWQDAPASIGDLVGFILIIPVLGLGLRLVTAPYRPLLYGSTALWLFNRLWAVAPDGSPLRRVLLLLGSGLAVAGGIWLVRRLGDETTSLGRWGYAALTGLYIGTAMLLASVFANIFGWSTLAQILNEAVLAATYGGVGWTVAILVTVAVVPLVSRSPVGRLLPSLGRHEAELARWTLGLLAIWAIVNWTDSLVDALRIDDVVYPRLTAMLEASLVVGSLNLSLGRIVGAVVIVIVTVLFARLVRFILREEIIPRLDLPGGVDHSTIQLVNYAVVATGIVMAAAAAGVDGTQLTVLFGALGVGIGFGLQNVITNFISGLILMFERPVKVGDMVQTTTHFGTITGIGIRASRIRTFDGAEVVVPNGDLVTKDVINWTLSDQLRRIEIDVRVPYGTDPGRVMDLLREAVGTHPMVLDEPAPVALMTGFGESALEFRTLAWTRIPNFLSAKSDLHAVICRALGDAGIVIPVPQRDLHVKSVSPGSALVLDGIGQADDTPTPEPLAESKT